MSGRIVVGYTATDAGEDAVALGARLAAASGSSLDVVVVLPADDRSVITPPDASYDRYLQDQAATWLDAATDGIPEAVAHSTNVRYADSFAEGLVAAASEFGASHIVVGAANGGLRGRHRLGSVATELLHSSNVPVVLAPEGSRRVDTSTGVTRITAAIGTRPGADALLEEATSLADATGAELRLLSLVTVDLPAERRHRRHPDRRCRPRGRGARPGARRAVGRQRRRGGRRPRRQHRRRRAAPQLGAGRSGDRRLQPPRAAEAPVPRLDRCQDAS